MREPSGAQMLKEFFERNGLMGVKKNRDTLIVPLALNRQLRIHVVKQDYRGPRK